MYYYKEDEFNYSDIIKISLVYLLFVLLLVVNFHIAEVLCNIGNISFNLELSIMSIGFGYELTLVLSLIELSVSCYYISKLVNKH
ncbi:MAG: hypothetical protein IJ134_04520 [Bacilli bacterium]|nr:hypothetical protein [Bacilli bacterium]